MTHNVSYFIDGLIKIKYLIHSLLLIYILQSFTNIKIPVSFDDFEQFAKNMVDLMNFQVWIRNVRIWFYQIPIITDFVVTVWHVINRFVHFADLFINGNHFWKRISCEFNIVKFDFFWLFHNILTSNQSTPHPNQSTHLLRSHTYWAREFS